MKHVLITGASSGIGRQLALDYYHSGWQITACGRNQEKLTHALSGIKFEPCIFDLQDRKAIQAAMDQLADFDVVVLNAGSCEYIDDVMHFDAELFARVINTNLIGTANCLPALLPRIKQGGRLAIISSSVSFLPLTRAQAYGASKAGIDYLARSLAIDLWRHDIRVCLIRPGFVDTPLTQKNDFPMPNQVTAKAASHAIRKGIAKGRSEICFPFSFITVLRLLSWLPNGLWRLLSQPLVRNSL
jgi:NAD(P)-dependent dehydrogenase (short-subunit alcohol dehydrogenase family)